MATPDSTTFVSLFHHPEQAQGVVKDLIEAGVPANVIYTLDRQGNASDEDANRYRATLEELHVPARDIKHLLEEIGKGAILIAVAFASDFTDRVENIFERHAATKIDEAILSDGAVLDASKNPELERDNTVGTFGSRSYRPIVPGTSLDDDTRR